MAKSATFGSWFFGSSSDRAESYLAKWKHKGKTQAPAARAGVISALLGETDPTEGRTMFEGKGLLKKSSFKRKFIDKNYAYDPIDLGGTRFFKERSKSAGDKITNAQKAARKADE